MPLDAISNVLPFLPPRLSRQDHALIEQWRVGAAPLGIAGVTVPDDSSPDNHAQRSPDRIAIQIQPGVADGHFIMMQRAHGDRTWVTVLLRLEPDGTMTLPIDCGEVVRQDGSLREALNAVRPVLPEGDCRLLDYQAAARSARSRSAARVAGARANAT